MRDVLESQLSKPRIVYSKYPLTMEQMDMNYGFALYSSKFNRTLSNQQTGNLSIPGVHDRAIIFANGVRTIVTAD